MTLVDCPSLLDIDLSASLLLQKLFFQPEDLGSAASLPGSPHYETTAALKRCCPSLRTINLRDTVGTHDPLHASVLSARLQPQEVWEAAQDLVAHPSLGRSVYVTHDRSDPTAPLVLWTDG